MAHLLWPDSLKQDVSVKTLSDPGLRTRFLAFLQGEHALENAWFALAVAQYRASPYWVEADLIYDLFIEIPPHRASRPTPVPAPFQVNISGAAGSALKQYYAGARGSSIPPQDLFDAPLTEVVKLMSRDTYRRFTVDMGVGLEKKEGGNKLARIVKNGWEEHQKKKCAKVAMRLVTGQDKCDHEYLKRKLGRGGAFDWSIMGLA